MVQEWSNMFRQLWRQQPGHTVCPTHTLTHLVYTFSSGKHTCCITAEHVLHILKSIFLFGQICNYRKEDISVVLIFLQ